MAGSVDFKGLEDTTMAGFSSRSSSMVMRMDRVPSPLSFS